MARQAVDAIPGLQGWWRADAITGSSGSAVSTWPDSGPNNYAATQATSSAQPTLQTGVINGRSVVRFDGVDDFLSSAAPAATLASTIVSVVRVNNTSADHEIRAGDASGALIHRIRTGTLSMSTQGGVGIGSGATAINTAAFAVLTTTYTDTGDAYAFYFDGAADNAGATTVSVSGAATTRIGFSTGTRFLNGDLAELIVYDRVLTAAERADVHSELQDYYGIAVADYVPGSVEAATTAGTILVQGPAPAVAHVVHTTPGQIVVQGPAPTVELIDPTVRADTAAGAVVVEGPAVSLREIAHPTSGTVEVLGPPVTVAHVLHTTPGEIVVAGPAASAGSTAPAAGAVLIEGPPAVVSIGSEVSASRHGLPPVLYPPTTRIIAQSILDGRFLDWELPLLGPEITWTVNGPTLISGTLAPEVESLTELGLDAWGTLLHIEDSGLIRASGILLPTVLDPDAASLTVDAVGVSGYAARVPYRGVLDLRGGTGMVGVALDPAEIVRHIWAHIQSYPRGNLGVTVSGSTPVRIGEEEREVQFTTGDGQDVSFTAGPYRLAWWENTLCGKEIDDLATETPFDYRERVRWNPDRTAVEQYIDIGYPRLGVRQFGLRFATGENILEHAPIEEPDNAYADSVFVQGKGEGSSAVTGYAGVSVGGRLRLPAVVEDKTIDSATRARARASDELSARLASLIEVPEIAVDIRHDNALLGTFSPGDDILVELHDVPFLGTYRAWSRITSIKYVVDREVAVLSLSRAAEFTDR